MRLQNQISLLRRFRQLEDQLDISFSGLVILAAVAALHITSAGIDLREAVQAATLGPENLIQVSDVVTGAALAIFPFVRTRMRRFLRLRREGGRDMSCP